jgi:hypothetical protein
LLMDRDKMSNLYRGPSIDAPYQVSVHMAEGFQRRRLKCEKLTDDRRQVMAKAHITHLLFLSRSVVVAIVFGFTITYVISAYWH